MGQTFYIGILLIWSSLLQLTVETRDLSKAENSITAGTAKQIHKMVLGEKKLSFWVKRVNLLSLR